MSIGARGPLNLGDAERMANNVIELIHPTVKRVVVAGSIRRRKKVVNDIELVAEPFLNEDLFAEAGTPVLGELHSELRKVGTILKGGLRYIQVGDLFGNDGVKLDLFLVHPPAQWGSILAIRTGPPVLSKYVVSEMKKFGFQHQQGHVVDEAGDVVPTPTEEDFFRLADLNVHPPEDRDNLALTLVTFQK